MLVQFFVAKICKCALRASTEGYLAVAASTPSSATLVVTKGFKILPNNICHKNVHNSCCHLSKDAPFPVSSVNVAAALYNFIAHLWIEKTKSKKNPSVKKLVFIHICCSPTVGLEHKRMFVESRIFFCTEEIIFIFLISAQIKHNFDFYFFQLR